MALTIRVNQQSYRIGDTVPLEVQLTNTGTSALYLFDDVCWNPGNFLTFHVFTTEGKEVSGKLDYLRDCLPPPPRRDDISSFIRLEPRTFYGVLEDFTARDDLAHTCWRCAVTVLEQKSMYPVVETPHGELRGSIADGLNTFEDIPYPT